MSPIEFTSSDRGPTVNPPAHDGRRLELIDLRRNYGPHKTRRQPRL